MPTRVDLPPPLLDLDHGGSSGWVELTRADNDIDAHLIAGRLSESGIETRTVKDRSGPGAWLYGGSNPWAPAAILVRQIQLEDARLVLAEVAFAAPAVDPTVVATPTRPRRRWLFPLTWWAVALFLGLLLTAVALLNTSAAIKKSCDLPLLCGSATEGAR